MSSEITLDIEALIDSWIESERNGVQFPVPFAAAWEIAGYKRKDIAKRSLSALIDGEDFSTEKWKSNGGRDSEVFSLTCDAFKHFCIMAKTEKGRLIRTYFIEAEKKWKLVQQIAPKVANEVEMMHLKIELAKIEAQKEVAIAQAKQSDMQLLQFRHFVSTALPDFQKKEVLGYEVIEKTEFVNQVVDTDGFVLNDGSTITKKELCDRLHLKTKNGKPDYKKLNEYLQELPEKAFNKVSRMQSNDELKRSWVSELEGLVNGCTRQRWIGETA